ncbi:unnamed protein product [Prorocentrum cordatum]|uniref:Uncharacterized protein n=1 Tax=Prorocentrum cordatum TaxID=2364126 RepID=A0ABN9W9M6_9DINO|nr:unnamed protein product [Polarella glacialis]
MPPSLMQEYGQRYGQRLNGSLTLRFPGGPCSEHRLARSDYCWALLPTVHAVKWRDGATCSPAATFNFRPLDNCAGARRRLTTNPRTTQNTLYIQRCTTYN